MKIAPEGVPFVLGGVAVLGVLAVGAGAAGGGWWYALPAAWLPIAAWVPVFFRNPDRAGPRGPGLILAPADGKVVSVIEVDEPQFIGGRALRISVFMNVFNVHVNRYPVDGRIALRDYRPGTFVNAALDKASTDNEQMVLGIRNDRGPVLVRQIAGLIARRIVTDGRVGDPTRQGERLGLIRFGSRVDTFLPVGAATPQVVVGQRTQAGITVIGEWR
jgi:phosphatidylserine decarboxylase